MTPLVYRPLRGRLIVLLLGAFALIATSVSLLGFVPTPKNVVLGVIGIGFFGLCGVAIVRQLFDTEPRLIIDDNGVFDRTLKVGCIEWSEILGAEVRSVSGQTFIALHVKDLAKHMAKLSPLHRRMTQANQALGFAALNLNLSALDVEPIALTMTIAKEAARRRESAEASDAAVR